MALSRGPRTLWRGQGYTLRVSAVPAQREDRREGEKPGQRAHTLTMIVLGDRCTDVPQGRQPHGSRRHCSCLRGPTRTKLGSVVEEVFARRCCWDFLLAEAIGDFTECQLLV